MKPKAVENNTYKNPYIIIDEETGELLDDAQGYGYRTIRGAYAAYFYKNRSDEEKLKEYELMTESYNWIKDNKDTMDLIESNCWYDYKSSLQCGDKPRSELEIAKETLKELNVTVDFPIRYIFKDHDKFFKQWNKRHKKK